MGRRGRGGVNKKGQKGLRPGERAAAPEGARRAGRARGEGVEMLADLLDCAAGKVRFRRDAQQRDAAGLDVVFALAFLEQGALDGRCGGAVFLAAVVFDSEADVEEHVHAPDGPAALVEYVDLLKWCGQAVFPEADLQLRFARAFGESGDEARGRAGALGAVADGLSTLPVKPLAPLMPRDFLCVQRGLRGDDGIVQRVPKPQVMARIQQSAGPDFAELCGDQHGALALPRRREVAL